MKTIAQVSLRVLNRRATGFNTGFIQKIATIFSKTLQGPPTRNIISKIVQKCTFPVYSNKT